jgi:serine/threonine protein kinase
MPTPDASLLAQLAIRLGLITEAQLDQCWAELGERTGNPDALLRVLERRGFLTPWQTHKLLKGEMDGYFLGGYRILYRIKSGSFGRVMRAEDPRTGREVAIKVLRHRWTDDPRSVELFMREARIGMTLHHPNIVEVLAVNRDEPTGQYYIVMEFVEGGNLRELMAIRKKLEPAEALRVLEEAATGLAYAYSQGVTHRDMKLSNILISSQRTAKLVDFGLAGLYTAVGGNADAKLERTVDYAGLEKATRVEPGDVRSDIYFLGCVLYEMLSGRSPLVLHKNPRARMERQRFADVQPLKRSELTAPPSVFRLVDAMMTLDVKHRYQTPSQLLDAIRGVRREIDDNPDARRVPRSVFVIERKERLQNAIRERFKELGYRVFLASDPARALTRFTQQPFDALVVDVGAAEDEGMVVFKQVMDEAERLGLQCAGIALLAEDQTDWAKRIEPQPNVAVMVRPVTLRQLSDKLCELVPPPGGGQTAAT